MFTSDGYFDWKPCNISETSCPNIAYLSNEVYKCKYLFDFKIYLEIRFTSLKIYYLKFQFHGALATIHPETKRMLFESLIFIFKI